MRIKAHNNPLVSQNGAHRCVFAANQQRRPAADTTRGVSPSYPARFTYSELSPIDAELDITITITAAVLVSATHYHAASAGINKGVIKN
jgi:hypothetical protein